jgi:hypothetical protein
MEGKSILSYGLVDVWDTNKTEYQFKDLVSVSDVFKSPDECKITCLTYKRNDDTEKLRQDLQDEILNLGYGTKEDLEESLKESSETINRNKLTYWLNPFDKSKDRDQKISAGGMIAMHAAPFVMIPASFFTSSTASTVLASTGGTFGFFDIASAFFRRNTISKEKESMKNLEEKFKEPKNEYFCRLKELAPKISVENVFVEDAHNLVESMKTFNLVNLRAWWGETKIEKNYNLVNRELMKIYNSYSSQPKT